MTRRPENAHILVGRGRIRREIFVRPSDNTSTLREMLLAFNAGDLAAVRRLVHDRVIYSIATSTQLAGPHHGREAALEAVQRMVKMTDGTLRAELHDFLANDQHGIAIIRWSATRCERTLDYEMIDIYHVWDGVIVEVQSVPVDRVAFDDFWADPPAQPLPPASNKRESPVR